MSRVLQYLLTHLSCLLIALPIGWCCWVPTTSAKDDVGKLKCCCGGEQDRPVPVKPLPMPKAPPCCCQATLALSASPQEDGQDSNTFVFLPPGFDAWRDEFSAFAHKSPPPRWLDSSPSLQVLYCTWLC